MRVTAAGGGWIMMARTAGARSRRRHQGPPPTGGARIKQTAFAFVTFVAVTAAISTANAAGVDHLKTGTAFDIAQQYADGGTFGGVTSGTTGSALWASRRSHH